MLKAIKIVVLSGCLEVATPLQQRITVVIRYAVQCGLIDYKPSQDMAGAIASGKRQHRAALELKRLPELLNRLDCYVGRPLTKLAVQLTLLVLLELNRLPELISRIEHYVGRPLTKLAVQLTLLVFIRSSELRFARWNEIDFENAIWTIPAERKP